MVPFSLFHGTSSHYVADFRLGEPPMGWPHKDVAIALLRDACDALRALGSAPDWYIERILDQKSGYSNWQHGDLYVTPSRQSAVRYAASNAAFGGEFLTFCKEALDHLAELDPHRAKLLLHDAEPVVGLLNGDGEPILVEFAEVSEDDLGPERPDDDVLQQLASLTDLSDEMREVVGQQTNFRLRNGVVARVFDLKIEDTTNPVSTF